MQRAVLIGTKCNVCARLALPVAAMQCALCVHTAHTQMGALAKAMAVESTTRRDATTTATETTTTTTTTNKRVGREYKMER